jgi:hypothetical protein
MANKSLFNSIVTRPSVVSPTTLGKSLNALPTNFATDQLSIATAGAVTYTAIQFRDYGRIARDCNGAGRTDTVPTAALLVAAFPAQLRDIGDSLSFPIANVSDAAETITIQGSTGVTLSGVATIAQGKTRYLTFVRTSAAGASPTFDLVLTGAVPVDVSGPLNVTGAISATTTVQGADLVATDDLTVGDDAAIAGALTVGETAAITGNTTVGGTLGVTGASSVARILATGLVVRRLTTNTVNTASDVTVTAAQVLAGCYLRDPNGGARSDTLTTGALLDAADTSLATGDSFSLLYANTADAAETITLGMGIGLTSRSGTITIAQNQSTLLMFVKTGTATYDVYRL